MAAPPLVAPPDVDREVYLPPGPGHEPVGHAHEVARHQREQVGRLRVRIDPPHPAEPALDAGAGRIAVRQLHRTRVRIGPQRHLVACHHVRPVRKERNPPETLRLALRDVVPARHVKTRQFRICPRRVPDRDLERERVGEVVDQQRIVRQHVSLRPEPHAVDRHREQLHPLAVEPQAAAVALRIASHRQTRPHQCRLRIERDVQHDVVHEERGRPVIHAPDHRAR